MNLTIHKRFLNKMEALSILITLHTHHSSLFSLASYFTYISICYIFLAIDESLIHNTKKTTSRTNHQPFARVGNDSYINPILYKQQQFT